MVIVYQSAERWLQGRSPNFRCIAIISWKFLIIEWHHSQWPTIYQKIFPELSRMMNSWYTCGAVTRTIELSTISVTILCNGPTSQMLHNCLEPTGDRLRLKSHSTPDWWRCIACFCMLFRNTCPKFELYSKALSLSYILSIFEGQPHISTAPVEGLYASPYAC